MSICTALPDRQYHGLLSRTTSDFYSHVWQLFQYSGGIEHLLNKIPAPEYRQLNLEALRVLASIVEQNQSLYIDDYLVLDVVIGHAVRLAYLHRHPERETTYSEYKAAAPFQDRVFGPGVSLFSQFWA